MVKKIDFRFWALLDFAFQLFLSQDEEIFLVAKLDRGRSRVKPVDPPGSHVHCRNFSRAVGSDCTQRPLVHGVEVNGLALMADVLVRGI